MKKKQSHYHAWIILPEKFRLRILTQQEHFNLFTKKPSKIVDIGALEASVETKTTTTLFELDTGFAKQPFKPLFHGPRDKAILVEFSSDKRDFGGEQVLIQLGQAGKPTRPFRVNLKLHRNRALTFVDCSPERLADWDFFETQLLLVRASLARPRIIGAARKAFDSRIGEYVREFRRSRWGEPTLHDSCKAALANFLSSGMHVHLAAGNSELYFRFLGLTLALTVKYYEEDAQFRDTFDKFRRSLKDRIGYGNAELLLAFCRFENDFIDTGVTSDKLIDRMRRISNCALLGNQSKLLRHMADETLPRCTVGGEERAEAIFLFLSIELDTSLVSPAQSGALQALTRSLSSFEGRCTWRNPQNWPGSAVFSGSCPGVWAPSA